MSSGVFVYGKWEDPSSWNFLKEGYKFDGAMLLQGGYFSRQFDNKAAAKEWILAELQTRMATLAELQHQWDKFPIPGNSSD